MRYQVALKFKFTSLRELTALHLPKNPIAPEAPFPVTYTPHVNFWIKPSGDRLLFVSQSGTDPKSLFSRSSHWRTLHRKNTLGSVVSNRIWMKCGTIVPRINTHRETESDFWYGVILSRCTQAVCVLCSEHHREKSASDSEENQKPSQDQRAAGLTGVVKSVKSLVTNGVYVFSVLYDTCDMTVTEGFLVFGPKFFQQQFGLTATMAGIAFGSSLPALFDRLYFDIWTISGDSSILWYLGLIHVPVDILLWSSGCFVTFELFCCFSVFRYFGDLCDIFANS